MSNIFQDTEFVTSDLAFFVDVLGQLTAGHGSHNLIFVVEVDKVDESVFLEESVISEFLLPSKKLSGVLEHEFEGFLVGKIETFPDFIGCQKLGSKKLRDFYNVIFGDWSQSVLVVGDVHNIVDHIRLSVEVILENIPKTYVYNKLKC